MLSARAKTPVAALHKMKDATRAKSVCRFFKMEEGTYGHKDQFLGVPMAPIRKLASEHGSKVTLADCKAIACSEYNEQRILSVLMMVQLAEASRKKGSVGKRATTKTSAAAASSNIDPKDRAALWDAFVDLARRGGPDGGPAVNNWNLVDAAAPALTRYGLEHLPPNRRVSALVRLASHKSSNLWVRRISIVGCWLFIRDGSTAEVFAVAEALLGDNEDLIHKATGWMLREVGRCISKDPLREFLTTHGAAMAPVAMRYAVEHLGMEERKKFYALRKEAAEAARGRSAATSVGAKRRRTPSS